VIDWLRSRRVQVGRSVEIVVVLLMFLLLYIFTLPKKPKARLKKNLAGRGYTDSPKYRKLLTMLGGDRRAADRLINQYGVDKAISDLENDRRF